ncbi:MAG: hypothetical protein HY832_01845 [Candidatus Aenigmarchaeota archaeon]|nr:hypothetical protein [Candidatus Aenigmarchaeota archaeon]
MVREKSSWLPCWPGMAVEGKTYEFRSGGVIFKNGEFSSGCVSGRLEYRQAGVDYQVRALATSISGVLNIYEQGMPDSSYDPFDIVFEEMKKYIRDANKADRVFREAVRQKTKGCIDADETEQAFIEALSHECFQ